MKTTAKISAALNLALAGALVFVWINLRRPWAATALPAVARAEQLPPPAAQTPPPAAPQVVVETEPFRWSQLVSTNDYRVYVANLRNSGCPEPTVEDIVRGDAERTFAEMHRRLGIDGTTSGPWSAQSQMQLVASLLGQTPLPAAEPVVASQDHQEAEPATMAAFLQSVDLTALGQTDEQKREIADVRRSLLQQISGANQAPNNPGYLASQAGVNGTQPPQTAMDGAQPPPVGIDNPQSSQAGAGGKPSWLPPRISPSMLQASEAESMVGGLFGMGAAMQYEQYQATQAGQQNP